LILSVSEAMVFHHRSEGLPEFGGQRVDDLVMETPGRALGETCPEGLDRPAHMVDQLGADAHQRLPGVDECQVGLAVRVPVLYGIQQRGIEPEETGQLLGVDPVGLAALGVDEPYLPGVGHQHFVAQALKEPADPGRVRPYLDGNLQRPLRTEPTLEGLRGGTQPALLQYLAAFGVDEAEVAVLVPQV
jgi:hypothetical protein